MATLYERVLRNLRHSAASDGGVSMVIFLTSNHMCFLLQLPLIVGVLLSTGHMWKLVVECCEIVL